MENILESELFSLSKILENEKSQVNLRDNSKFSKTNASKRASGNFYFP